MQLAQVIMLELERAETHAHARAHNSLPC